MTTPISHLKTLFTRKPPLPVEPVALTQASLELSTLPTDVLYEIARFLTAPEDAYSLARTSSDFYALLSPFLRAFVDVHLKGVSWCKERLEFFISRPEVAHRIQKLVLQPSYQRISTPEGVDEEATLMPLIERLVPKLYSLHTFIWDGFEMLKDSIWRDLKRSCLKLKTVGNSIGKLDLPTDSEFFKFDDLAGLSLISSTRTIPHHRDNFNSHALPEKLWDMLLHRCPSLEVLSLGSVGSASSTRMLDLRPLLRGTWPMLHSLTLGRTTVREGDESNDASNHRFSHFVAAHPSIKKLHLPFNIEYYCLPHLQSTLESYSGPFSIANTATFRYCTELVACSDRHEPWYIPFLWQALKEIPLLQKFSLWIDLSEREHPLPDNVNALPLEMDQIKIFQSILASCPELLHLKLFCSTVAKHSLHMKDYSKALQDTKLKSLEIVKVYKSREEDMISTADRFARQVPSLEKIVLTYATRRWYTGERPIFRQRGVYEVFGDSSGQAVELDVTEQRGFCERRFQHNMRPIQKKIFGKLGLHSG